MQHFQVCEHNFGAHGQQVYSAASSAFQELLPSSPATMKSFIINLSFPVLSSTAKRVSRGGGGGGGGGSFFPSSLQKLACVPLFPQFFRFCSLLLQSARPPPTPHPPHTHTPLGQSAICCCLKISHAEIYFTICT